MIKAASLLALVAGSATLLHAQARAADQETFRIADDAVSVHNLAGTVEVVAGSGSDFIVEVIPGGADGDRLSVEMGQLDGRSALMVRYPENDVVYPIPGGGRYQASVRVREDGSIGRGGRAVEVRSAGRGMEAHADLRIQVPRGGRLTLHHGVGATTVRGVSGDLELDLAAAGVDVDGVFGDLRVDTGSGSVTARNVDGSVEVDTGSGSVELESISGANVIVDTGSGSILAGGITTGVLEVDTGSGRVEVWDLSAEDVNVDTGSGRVELRLVDGAESVVVDTGSGSVLLVLPTDMSTEIEVDTGSGGIDLDLPVEVRGRERGYFRGVLGSGRGRVLVDTGSGSVRIQGG